MSIFFTADMHFMHDNIIYYTKRPFATIKDMNKVLKKNWNEVVSDDDIVYVLGDVHVHFNIELIKLEKICRSLNGKKILILGNHDRLPVFDYINILGFESVHTFLYLDEYHLNLTHDPATCINYGVKNQRWLCGHVHNLFKRLGDVINVGVDVWDYKPVSLDVILEEFDKDARV